MKTVLVAFAGLALAGVASGQTWNESGDAGELVGTAQNVNGAGALTRINGTIGTADDVDLYRIAITDEAQFFASTINNTNLDTQLFLFDNNGNGIAFNDDEPGGSGLWSRISSSFVVTNGTYLLGISSYDRDAVSAGGEIWADQPFGSERAPDGPGRTGTLSAWSGAGSGPGSYGIDLRGASFIPAPGALAILGLGGLAASRRRRA